MRLETKAFIEEFIEIQTKNKDKNEKLGQLQSWPDSRWCCRIAAIRSVDSTLPYIILTLKLVSSNDSNADRRFKVNSLLHHIDNFQFLFLLHLMKEIFSATEALTECLQKKSFHAKASIDLIEATLESLEDMDDEWVERQLEVCRERAEEMNISCTFKNGGLNFLLVSEMRLTWKILAMASDRGVVKTELWPDRYLQIAFVHFVMK